MQSSDRQVYSDSDESLDNFRRKKTKISDIKGKSFDRDISIDESSQNYDDIEMDNYFDHKNQNLENNQNVSSGVSDDDDYNINDYEDSESEDYVPISDGEFELEKYVTNDTNSKTDETDGESVKDVSVGVNDYNNDGERMTKNYKHIGVDDGELYDLLDKPYRGKNKPHNEHNKKVVTPDDYQEHEKYVLEQLSKNHFDILPENWIETIHKSGMPIYLHKKSRVVTLSRPYFLGPGDPKSHLAPLSAISCLNYRKGLEKKETIKNEPNFHVSKLGDLIIPNAKVETAQENIIKESLSHEELREYCKSLFKFKVEEVKSLNKTPKEQNIKTEISMLKNIKERPSLPDSTKFISFPFQTKDHNKRYNRRREWILNPNGKSYVCILHEYLQQALKTQPWYEYKELESTETPYSATVVLNDVQYGVGLGNSKKQAKLNAAQATLDILLPEIKNKIDSNIKNQRDPVIFDQIKVTDPRVTEFCAKTTEPSPYAMLLVCLQRNFGECEIGIEFKLTNRHRMLNQCTMTVGKHTASVACKNKRDGKQKASQIILGLLHPHIDNWGSLLRLYGNRSIKNAKEKKQEEQEITQLQSKAAANQPNFAILNKLKEEMLKIRDQRKLKETNEMLGLSPTMLATTCPYTIVNPSSSTSHN
ncbi:microprocessor complex subunit DGCR8-like [Acyrthosiphon pisum]|uniref:DRBM domain-containing protein n=1 Tax=Acyrthosiphon pisum TaxID=7029 RepID=A0A8R2H350_ACYPI|nr:microprocessor complex subunit DGCR8-like [Acyrthosiphon pisum]|eukprot:XP_016657415.1 PREDICTED: microprocessor complex subunit DGCR8-like [Acyrthosiphon pisum]